MILPMLAVSGSTASASASRWSFGTEHRAALRRRPGRSGIHSRRAWRGRRRQRTERPRRFPLVMNRRACRASHAPLVVSLDPPAYRMATRLAVAAEKINLRGPGGRRQFRHRCAARSAADRLGRGLRAQPQRSAEIQRLRTNTPRRRWAGCPHRRICGRRAGTGRLAPPCADRAGRRSAYALGTADD